MRKVGLQHEGATNTAERQLSGVHERTRHRNTRRHGAGRYCGLLLQTRCPDARFDGSGAPQSCHLADPTVPDRTLALTEDGPDPTPWLLRGARVLRESGATTLAIPCNTAHAFLPAISSQLGLPVVHMIDEVARHIRTLSPAVTSVGLLATTGTVRTGLYQQWLSEYSIDVLVPGPAIQDELVMPAIRAIKSGNVGDETTDKLVRAADLLVESGAQVVVAGCTEIPLGLPPTPQPVRSSIRQQFSPALCSGGLRMPGDTLRWSFRADLQQGGCRVRYPVCCVAVNRLSEHE